MVLGPVHTETFSCVFVLFIVLKGIENNQLITLKQYKKNAEKRFRVYGRNSSRLSASLRRPEDVKILRLALYTERGRN